jgi:hypothetical protein
MFPSADGAVGPFLAGFLKENCTLDASLTEESRRQKSEAIFAADRYEAGTVLVKRSQIIDAKTKRALDELRLKAPAPTPRQEEIVAPPVDPPPPLPKPMPALQLPADRTTHSGSQLPWGWLAPLGGAGALVVIAFILYFRSRRRTRMSPPALAKHTELALVDAEDGLWQQRALAAEQRAETLSAIVKAGLIPNLAQWLSQHFVRSMAAERASMLDAQLLAEQEVAQLEERLTALHAPLAERLHAYEQRIAELEQLLAARDQENLELIQAKIRQTRKRLKAERGDEPLAWN